MPLPTSDLISLMLVSALYVTAGHFSFEHMALLARIDENAMDEHAFLDALRRDESSALIVWAAYMAAWPVFRIYGHMRHWLDRSG